MYFKCVDVKDVKFKPKRDPIKGSDIIMFLLSFILSSIGGRYSEGYAIKFIFK